MTTEASAGLESRKLAVFQRVILAWNAGDLDGALAPMSDDIVWRCAATGLPPARGKAKARRRLESFRSGLREVRWTLFNWAESGPRLFVEGADEFVTVEGAVVRAPYAGVLEFEGDLIVAWRDYVDIGVTKAGTAGGGTRPWAVSPVERPAI